MTTTPPDPAETNPHGHSNPNEDDPDDAVAVNPPERAPSEETEGEARPT